MQTSFLNVHVLHEIVSPFDGAKVLKIVSKCDDGYEYATKRLIDDARIPICEWVGYHLWRACDLLTPEFAILYYADRRPPAFGSRIENPYNGTLKDTGSSSVASFFKPHLSDIAKIYPVDAFLPNIDRHGCNFLLRQTITTTTLLSIDYSHAWVRTGHPFGDTSKLVKSNTHSWWKHFRGRMKVQGDFSALEKIGSLPDDWLTKVITSAPKEWVKGLDIHSIDTFWRNDRASRIQFAKDWITRS